MTIDRTLDTSVLQPVPAELMARVLENMSDCRHLKMFCGDRRYAAMCIQHHVYRKFVRQNRWRVPQNFTIQDFDRECAYYSAFVASPANIIDPALYDRRMSFVHNIEAFIERMYDEAMQQEVQLRRDLFCSSVCNFVNDAIVEHILPPFSADGFQIAGIPDGDDLTYQSYNDVSGLISSQLSDMGYEGSSLHNQLREVNDDHHCT